MAFIVDASEEVNSRLWYKARHQQEIPEALVQIIQTEFNKSLRKVFTGALTVRRPQLVNMACTLTLVHFRPEIVEIPGNLREAVRQKIGQQRTWGAEPA